MTEQDFLNEETQNGESFDGAAPSADEAAQEAKDDRKWYLDDGSEVSKSEFVREQFIKHNKSRKEISEEFDINYRTVYGATVNMTNDAEPAGRGRSAQNQKILVTPEGDVVTEEDGVIHINNVAVADEEGQAAKDKAEEKDRNEWIREQVEAGVSRGDVAKALGLSYGVIYSITKDLSSASQRHEMEYNGETVSRSEYIRRRYLNDNVSKSDLAKELDVDYPVVWSALKVLKSENEKYQDAVSRLDKFESQMVDPAAFRTLLDSLKQLEVKEPEDEKNESDSADAESKEAETAATGDSVYAE